MAENDPLAELLAAMGFGVTTLDVDDDPEPEEDGEPWHAC